ncbi:MAG: presenilin family intramembrane aspartyl protease [Candidatus Anstonellales archaeon]
MVVLEHFFKYAFVIIISYLLAIATLSNQSQPLQQLPPNEEVAITSFIFFLIGALLIFIAIKYLNVGFLLNIFEFILLFFSSYVIAYALLQNYGLALIAAIATTFLRALRFISMNNAALITSIGGALIIGVIFPIFPLIIFAFLLVLYDIFAVFISGHMIELAHIAKKQEAAMAIETKQIKKIGRKKAILSIIMGTGDFVLPSAIAISSIQQSMPLSLYMLLAGLIGYWFVMLVLYKLKRPLPALPFILFPQFIIFLLYFLGFSI